MSKYDLFLIVLLFWTIFSSFFQVMGAVMFSIEYGISYVPHLFIIVNGIICFILCMLIGNEGARRR